MMNCDKCIRYAKILQLHGCQYILSIIIHITRLMYAFTFVSFLSTFAVKYFV